MNIHFLSITYILLMTFFLPNEKIDHNVHSKIDNGSEFIFLKEYNSCEDILYRGLGKVHINDFKGAIEEYTKGIEQCKEKSGFYALRSSAKMSLELYKDALKDQNEAIKLDAKNNSAYFLRGVNNLKLGNKKQACSDLIKATELGNKNSKEYFDKYCK